MKENIMKFIKYGNRKLYSPSVSKYIRLETIGPCLLMGDTVTCHKTRIDLTHEVLNQYISRHVLAKMDKQQLIDLVKGTL